ncbi:MAG TPA: LysM peptidoglycan-binding domain-containing protein, partial [Cytophagaceae bacterium]
MDLNKTMLRFYVFCFLAFSLGLNIPGFTSPLDSIGVEKKKGKIYILHKTEAKETFFSISKKYNVTVGALKTENPEIASGLKVGHIIQVPYKGKLPTASKNEQAKAPTSNTASSSSSKTHTVASKETLYSISKKYNVSVDELKRANGNSSSLQPGDKIIIPTKGSPSPVVAKESPKKEERIEEPAPVSKPEKAVVKSEPKQEEKRKEEPRPAKSMKEAPVAYKPDNESSFKKITESGVAELLDDKSGFHVGLHKSAPVGTIIQVKNTENNSKIFLRIIGKLETENYGRTILKMSPKAFERLGA